MTIGTALKNIRKQLGLTQSEMASGVISTSFYSKVERGIHDIGINDLIKILDNHKVDKAYFFANLSNTQVNVINIMEQINSASDQRDRDQLIKIKKKIDSLPNNRTTEYYKLQLQLNLEVYLPKAKEIPAELKLKLKKYVFLNDNWDIYSLRIFRETMRIYEIDELSFLVNAILTKYPSPNNLQDTMQECIGAICVNFLDNCYENNAVDLTNRARDYINKIDSKSNLMLVKILGSYYDFIFDENEKACKKIIDVLNYAHYQNLVNILPKI